MDLPNVDPELLATLPPVLRAVVRALGYGRAQEWVTEFGGGWVYVPARDNPRAALQISLADDEATRLIDELEPLCTANRYVRVPAWENRKIANRCPASSVQPLDDDDDADTLQNLPPVLRAVVRALGYGRAQEWLREWGGLVINLPKHYTFALGLSRDELQRLRVELAPHLDSNDRFSVPKIDKLWIRHRNALINANKDWQSASKQARAYHLTVRQITNIRREGETDDRQMSLFD
ncbi:hypothetical protein [Methylomonas rosea]|uniref:Mor transcription activator family protein n=1 Tax=Methylomonas rosea TaxID=2952227 RepID=A0ABT1TMV6_9GAMM|nr:hypothetical protein [Methylomonas sp. WSC-7]MCQ8116110.1 hypothetical protein [Methylomonas sp. WSC-7]